MTNKYVTCNNNKSITVYISDTGLYICRSHDKADGSAQKLRKELSKFFASCGYKLDGRIYNILEELISYYGNQAISFIRIKQDLLVGKLKIAELIKADTCIACYTVNSSEGYGGTLYTIEKLGDTGLKVSRLGIDRYSELRDCNDIHRKQIGDWCKEKYVACGVQRKFGKDMVSMTKFAGLVCQHYPNNTILNIEDIMDDAKAGKIKLSVCSDDRAIMRYILLVERCNIYKEFLTFNIHMRNSMSHPQIIEWYKKSKGELYKLLKEKFESNKALNRNLNYYDLYSAKIQVGNILSLTFKLKDGLLKIEREMQEEEQKKIDQKEEYRSNKRYAYKR